MQRFPAEAIRACLSDLLAQSRQEATRTTLVIAPGVDYAKAYADVIDAERSCHVLPEAACDVSRVTKPHELISAVQAIGNDQGSIALPAEYERRIATATAALLVEDRRHEVGALPVEVTDIGVFLHRMPVMSCWPGEVQARLHRWSLSSDWAEIISKLVRLSLDDRTRTDESDTDFPIDDMTTLLRFFDAVYALLCLDTIAYIAAALTSAIRQKPTARHRLPKHRLIVLVRRQLTTSFLVGLTRTP